MQFLFIAALLLVAVAAHPDFQKPWQENKFPPIGGARPDFKPGDNEHVIKSPGDGDAGSGGDRSEWSHELNRPSKVPGKGNTQGPVRGDDGSDRQPGRPSQASNRGKRQAPAFGVMTDEPGVPRPGPGRHFGRPRGPPRGEGPNMRNPPARPDSQKPWQENKFPPIGGPQPDFKPGDNEHVIKSPEDGDAGSGGDRSEWSHELNRPSKVPGKGNTQGPVRGDDGSDRQPGRPSQASNRGKRQAPAFGVMTDEPGVPRPGPGRHFGRPRGPPRGKGPNMRNPAARGNMVFSPIFKVNSVTFQNVTDVPLTEGENIFLLPKHGRSGPHHHKGGKHGPPKNEQYLKLIYNATEPNTFSIEYGVLKPINIGELFGEEDNLEDGY